MAKLKEVISGHVYVGTFEEIVKQMMDRSFYGTKTIDDYMSEVITRMRQSHVPLSTWNEPLSCEKFIIILAAAGIVDIDP